LRKDYIVKQLYLLLLLIFVTSCNGQVNTGSSKNSTSKSDINPVIPNKNNQTAYEPLFMKNDKAITYGPKSITRNILQDKNGKLWFASWEGIISYDGKYFTNVTLKESLKQLHVFSILEDKAGNIWFGTINGGLYRYDGKSFTLFTTTDGLANNSVLCMLEDNAGYIWFGTEAGVSRYDGKTFTNFSKQDGLNGNINSIIQDKTGKLWFGMRYGIIGDLIVMTGKLLRNLKTITDYPFQIFVPS
jgi:ligand-binding sensor domain-containing protein